MAAGTQAQTREHARLEQAPTAKVPWQLRGRYLTDRQRVALLLLLGGNLRSSADATTGVAG